MEKIKCTCSKNIKLIITGQEFMMFAVLTLTQPSFNTSIRLM